MDYKLGFSLGLVALVGSLLGAKIIVEIDEELLRKIVGGLILLMLVVVVFKKKIGVRKRIKKLSLLRVVLGYVFSFLVGVYIGFFGGGWSTLFSYVLILVFGQTFLESAGTRKIVGLLASSVALLVFVLDKRVNFLYGLVLFSAMVLGSYLGASYALKKGDVWVKRLFIVVVFLLAIKLLV